MKIKPTYIENSQPVTPFCFESYGVKVIINGNDQSLIDAAERKARTALVGNLGPIKSRTFDHEMLFLRKKWSRYKLIHNGFDFGWSRNKRNFLKFFDGILRVSVGEYAVDRVFLHAGAVGWKGKALIFPADSFKGKSTLVSELVRCGAEYYSDEFAVLDPDGILHPYGRPISMRTDDGQYIPFDITVEELGGSYGHLPIPVGAIVLTEHVRGRRWRAPKEVSPGAAMLAMIPFALPVRKQPDLTMSVLRTVSQNALVLAGKRGDANEYARDLLRFIDEKIKAF